MSGTVLVVDDERTLARAVKAFLQESGYEAEVAGNAEQALGLLETLRPDVVFSDLRLPGIDGIELLRRIRDFDPAIPVVIMTAYGTIEGAVEAVKLGAFDYLKKPVDLEELKLLADRARETSQLKQELSYYRRRAASQVPFSGVIGESAAIRSVLDQARQIAALDETPPVLITGETGTGKGLVARTIHASGPRSAKPFIEVNCTALPATLMEAELFGHERGAFTDAKESKMGLFEAAEGGFLFLDEVGDVEMSLQGKLLKAVEERTVRRVGGIRDRRINVRILAATNRDLESDSARDRFRRDLYFRLAVILLRLPPLRERGEDILFLADHFLSRFAAKYGKGVSGIENRARDLLLAYPWPGNVRELSHVIERAVLWSRGPTLDAEHLSLSTPTPAPDGVTARAPASDSAASLPPHGMDLEQWERSIIEQAIREADGNQTRAAQRLGISRDTLRYRLKKFGIQA
jgi:DNA-binding NtrC family response regulator